ncbi:MAG: LytTR family DNA-binding domain-containing protein [Pseudomonadota bacterium]
MQIAALIAVARTEGAPTARPPDEDFSVPIYLRTGRSVRGVPLAEITAIRADGDCSQIFLSNGSHLPDDRPMKWWQSVLPDADFLRVHRSAIANMRSIETLRRRSGRQDLELLVDNTVVPVPVSRAMAAEVRRRLGI